MSKARGATKGRRSPRTEKARAQSKRARRGKGVVTRRVVILALALVLVGVAFLAQRKRPGTSGPSEAFVGGDLHSLAASPQGALYVGGHQAVAVSEDGGKTWRQVSSLENADAMGWAFLSDMVAVGGHPGLHVSTDGGKTFRRRNEGLPATDVHGLGGAGSTLFAASPQVGIFASTDGGPSWSLRTKSAGQAFMGRIVVDASNPERLVAPDMSSGVVESTDGGRSWRRLRALAGAMWVSQDPRDPARLVASGMGGSVVTADGGKTWTDLEVPDDAAVVEVGSQGWNQLFAAVHDGDNAVVWVSRDGGKAWKRP